MSASRAPNITDTQQLPPLVPWMSRAAVRWSEAMFISDPITCKPQKLSSKRIILLSYFLAKYNLTIIILITFTNR
jgi:hypothetical protein